jgi:NDP-sugar pyrophosphorylase family protein
MQFLIPAAGLGSRFSALGYKEPKPMIELHGMPLILWVISNFKYSKEDVIFIAIRDKTVDQKKISKLTQNIKARIEFVTINELTDGAARTVDLASQSLDPKKPLIVANSDQFVSADLDPFRKMVETEGVDGAILTMKASSNKWSYVSKNDTENITRVVEKTEISSEATVGIYGWSKLLDFQESFAEMISNEDKTNNEYYLAPTYNYMIKKGKVIKPLNIGEINKNVFGLGTPEDLEYFKKLPTSIQSAQKINEFLSA